MILCNNGLEKGQGDVCLNDEGKVFGVVRYHDSKWLSDRCGPTISLAILAKMSLTNKFIILIALLYTPVSGWTCVNFDFITEVLLN